MLREYIALFGAGIASFLAPCVVPLVPAYLGMVAGESVDAHDASRAVPATAIFVLGFAYVTLGRTIEQCLHHNTRRWSAPPQQLSLFDQLIDSGAHQRYREQRQPHPFRNQSRPGTQAEVVSARHHCRRQQRGAPRTLR